jgi:hypothetical protein
VAISISLVFVAGCTSNAVAPQNGALDQTKLEWLNQFLGPDGAQRGSPFGDCVVLYDTLITKWVDDDDEEFALKFGTERIDFKVPEDALHDRTQLTLHITKYQAPFGSFWLLDCGPEGTVFAKPLEVKPNSQVTDGSRSVLFYFNPTTEQWEVQEIASPKNGELEIYHFSKYGIS